MQFSGFCCIHRVVQLSSSNPRTFSLSQKETPYLLTVTPHSPPLLSPQQPVIYFLSLWICLFWTFHINGITCVVLVSCFQGSPMLWHVSVSPFFLWSNNIPLYGYITFCLPTHPSVHRHSTCFHFWATLNKCRCENFVCVFVGVDVFISLGYKCR